MDLSISPSIFTTCLVKTSRRNLIKYNQDKKAQYKPTYPRMAKVHEQDHEEVDDSPDHPEPDLKNKF